MSESATIRKQILNFFIATIVLVVTLIHPALSAGDTEDSQRVDEHVTRNDRINYSGRPSGIGFPFYFRAGNCADLRTFYASNNAAVLLTCLQFGAAERLLKKEMQSESRIYPGTLRGIAAYLEGLAAIYDQQSEYPELKWIYDQTGKEKTIKAVHERDYGAVEALFGFGSVCNRRGKYDLADKQYRDAIDWFTCIGELQLRGEPWEPKLERYLEVAANGQADHAYRVIELAKIWQSQGRYEAAEGLYKALLDKYPETDADSKVNLDSKMNLSSVYAIILTAQAELFEEMDRWQDAEANYKKALEIDESTLGKDQPGVARDLVGLARVWKQQGKIEDAKEILGRVIAIDEKSFGSSHPTLAKDLCDFGDVLYACGNKAESTSAYERALSIDRKLLGSNHPCVAKDLARLGLFKEAEQILDFNLLQVKKYLGDDDPHVASLCEQFANVLSKMNRPEEAQRFDAQAKALRAKLRAAKDS